MKTRKGTSALLGKYVNSTKKLNSSTYEVSVATLSLIKSFINVIPKKEKVPTAWPLV
eukprot:TRINITY_DN5805_c0_g1_i1.p2 TRINITY_DN5805_c0_g1~~TRINITY_DN5805_c0_g1_i1.p2  ORF type:complete len:57 (+),score=15.93 TRINITY_DN5805_c0_g1_i1:246-416(+)